MKYNAKIYGIDKLTGIAQVEAVAYSPTICGVVLRYLRANKHFRETHSIGVWHKGEKEMRIEE